MEDNGPCGLVSVMAVCVASRNLKTKLLRFGIYFFAAMEWISDVGYKLFPWVAGADSRVKVAKEWSELNGVEITPEMINCVGCRFTGVKTPFCQSLCQIRQCALGRKVITCGDCNEMTACSKLSDIINIVRENPFR